MSERICQIRKVGKAVQLLLPTCLLMPVALHAQIEPKVSVDVSLNGTADSNPFLEQNGNSAVSATLRIDPRVYWDDETSSVSISGGLRMTQYLEDYGNDIGARLAVQARQAIDTRTSLSVSAGFQTSRTTLQDFFLGDLTGPLDTAKFPDTVFNDITIAGRRTRVTTLDAYIGLDHTLSASDSINIFGGTSYSRFGSSNESDYRTGTLGVRYRRRLSERTSVTAGLNATVSDYIGVREGDARILSPQVGIENKISERLTWTASVGASLASVDDQFGDARTTTYLTGELSLCDKGVKNKFCGSLSRSAEPTALGGIRAVTNVGVAYERQLSSNEQLSFAAHYGRAGPTSRPTLNPLPRRTQIFGLSAAYAKDINERFAFTVSPSVTKINETPGRNVSNYSLTAGIRMRLGKLR